MADELVVNGAGALAQTERSKAAAAVRGELARARAQLAYSARALRTDLRLFGIPAELKASMKRHPLLWLGGALAAGALLGKLSRKLF